MPSDREEIRGAWRKRVVAVVESGALRKKSENVLIKPFGLQDMLPYLEGDGPARSESAPIKSERGRLVLDEVSRSVQLQPSGPLVYLPQREFEILHLLFKNKNQIVSREAIGALFEIPADRGVVDVYISKIRRRIGDKGTIIRTIRGAGYILKDESIS